ncbi:MAG: transglutaminase domain-containing protein [Gemmatimonadetes bacterium]|nr:MAG: transglutaminase domain-containing protein [Gemmatimonadota bacterium]
MKLAFKLLNVLFILIWLVLIGMLLQRFYSGKHERLDIQNVIAQLEAREEWMGVYKDGVKIGFVGSSTYILPDGNYRFEQNWFMRLPVMQHLLDTRIEGYINTRPDFRPLDFSMTVVSAGQTMEFEGHVSEKMLRLDINAAGQHSQRHIPIKGKFTMPLAFEHMVPNLDLKPGKTYTFDMFDPLSQKTAPVEVELVERTLLTVLGETIYATKIRMTLNGMDSYTWIDPTGQSVKREETLLGLVMLRESKEAAMKIAPPPEIVATTSDLLVDVSIPVSRLIPDSRFTRSVTLRLVSKGVDWSQFLLETERQTILARTDSSVTVKISQTRPDLNDSLCLPLDTHGLDSWLMPTDFIQADADTIRHLARQILGEDHPQAWSAANRLGKWVFKHVEKVPTMSIPSAIEVLRTMQGDCNEHTTLFTALARAVGIPTRIALGVVYLDNAFYYHAWPEVWTGTRWVAMDPTFGDMIADATHLKLLEGEFDQYPKLLPLIGKMKIHVLNYQ